MGALSYVAGYAVSLVLLRIDRVLFARFHDLLGTPPVRLGLCVVVAATIYHAFDGLRETLTDMFPRAAQWSDRLRVLAVFMAPALGIPASLVIVWPMLAGT